MLNLFSDMMHVATRTKARNDRDAKRFYQRQKMRQNDEEFHKKMLQSSHNLFR